jgi:hypothetical protein
MSELNDNDFRMLSEELANMEADRITGKNVVRHLDKAKDLIIAINERVVLEERFGNDNDIKAFKILGYNLYRLRDIFEMLSKEL